MAKTLSAKEVAVALETTPKRLRKFLRSDDTIESPGKGGRYLIPAGKVSTLKRKFAAWKAVEDQKRIERLQQEVAEANAEEDETETDEVEVDSDEVDAEDED